MWFWSRIRMTVRVSTLDNSFQIDSHFKNGYVVRARSNRTNTSKILLFSFVFRIFTVHLLLFKVSILLNDDLGISKGVLWFSLSAIKCCSIANSNLELIRCKTHWEKMQAYLEHIKNRLSNWLTRIIFYRFFSFSLILFSFFLFVFAFSIRDQQTIYKRVHAILHNTLI